MKWNATFRPASTGLDHALMVDCGLTQMLAEAGRNVAFHFQYFLILGSMKNIFNIYDHIEPLPNLRKAEPIMAYIFVTMAIF